MSVLIKQVAPQHMLPEADCWLLDVRTEMEHTMTALQREHIHMPLQQLQVEEFMRIRHVDESKPLYILCGAGTRSMKAAEMFMQSGLRNVYVIKGGISACQTAGLALDVKPGMPLDRQIRIFIGSAVLLMTILSIFLHSGFHWLLIALGIGVLFSGISGWCGMALLLAKAPWNKLSPSCCRSR